MPLPQGGPALQARIDDLLPQTQCTRCGYADCAAYARAIAQEGAPIDRCPPGGAQGIERLAALTARPVLPLDTACGVEAPRGVAVIDEDCCIGCTLCLDACPVDAILGMNKRMHVVLAEHCTGCELCLPVCPVDCIDMVNASGTRTGWQAWTPAQASRARERYRQRQVRRTGSAPDARAASSASVQDRQAAIADVLQRARARRSGAAR